MSMQFTSQQQKALQNTIHLAVTANAGSGKTAVLTQRYLDIALTRVESLREIAAITFTDKAAAELYVKIAGALEKRLAAEQDPAVRRKLKQLRRQLLSANIATIHSFCISLLRQYPVEAGIDASFTPLDRRATAAMLEELLSRFIKEKIEATESANIIKPLIRVTGSVAKFATELNTLVTKRRLLEQNAALYAGTAEEIAAGSRQQAYTFIEEHVFSGLASVLQAAERINSNAEAEKKTETTEAVARLLQELRSAGTAKRLLLLADLKELILTKGNTVRKKGYLKSHEGVTETIAAVEGFFKEITPLLQPGDDAALHTLASLAKDLYHLGREAADRFEQEKIRSGVLDFEDILIFAARLLKHDSVRDGIAGTLKYIMIDEYQDTNELQYEIFLPILDNLKRGNLFVVGDEKQSIYMFRQAELEVFSRTKTDIHENSGETGLVTLPESFRMAPAICAFTNIVFERLFAGPNQAFNEVAHSPLICARQEHMEGGVEVILAEAEAKGGPNSEEELTARRMLELYRSSGPGSSDWRAFAVLCRKRDMFEGYAAAFRKYGIPFTVVGGTGFYQQQIVYDILNYTAFLANPEDNAALFGVLRSPFFNFSDADVFTINLGTGYSLFSKLCSAGTEACMAAAGELKAALAYAAGATPVELLRRITGSSPFIAVYAARPNGVQELANFNKLVQVAMQFTAKGLQGLFEFVEHLRENTELVDDEGQAAVAEESNSVRIMTIHQSKGLEFGTVVLAGCHAMPRIDSVTTKSFTITKEAGILIPVPAGGRYAGTYEKPLPVLLHNFIAKRKQIAEIKRLLYVGVTRAKDRLLLSMTQGEKSFSPASFASMLFSVLEPGEKMLSPVSVPLTFLVKKDDAFAHEERLFHLAIPIHRSVEGQDVFTPAETEARPAEIHTASVADRPRGEMISATRFAVYTQCPLKYYLKYTLRFEDLMNLPEFGVSDPGALGDNGEEQSSDEPLQALLREPYPGEAASIKGRVIHKLLESGGSSATALAEAQSLIQRETAYEWNEHSVSALASEAADAYLRAAASPKVQALLAAPDYRSEFAMHARHHDYYLHGILDRVIFSGSAATILDYKTDDIAAREITGRFTTYLPQLRFYAFLLSLLRPNLTVFTLQVVFIKHPDAECSLRLERDDLAATEKEINSFIESIRSDNFERVTSHCPECVFAKDRKHCVFPE